MKEETIIIILIVFIVIILWVAIDGILEGKIYKTICEISNIRYIAPNKMPFKSFVAFYNIAPTKWTLNNYVVYETIDREKLRVFDGIIPRKTYNFSFKFIDLIQYHIWHKCILHNEKIKEKKYKQKQLCQQYQDALKEISKDLEQFKQSKPWGDIKL